MPKPRRPVKENLSKFAPKRSEAEKENDRAKIAHWYLKGETQQAISEKLTISRSQVSQDLLLIQRRWKESAIRDFDDHKAEQLARLDVVEREYWAAWELSKRTKQRVTRKLVRTGRGKNRKLQPADVRTTAEGQCGDPRFLAGVESVIDKRCRIFGIYAPTKMDVRDLDRLLLQEFERVAGTADQPAGEMPLASELEQ